jgi:hypothetical protein
VVKTTWQRPLAARATSSPLAPGMRMSRKAMSGACSASASIAAGPSSHSATMRKPGQASASMRRSSARGSSSSSAISAVQARVVSFNSVSPAAG